MLAKKIVFIFLGFLVGIAFDMVPHAVEVVAKTNVCRESCSKLLKIVSVVIYAILPIAWTGLLGIVIGKPPRKTNTVHRRPFLSSDHASIYLVSLQAAAPMIIIRRSVTC